MTGAMQALIVAVAALGGLGVYLMIPRGAASNRATGLGISAAALIVLWVIWCVNFQSVEVGRGLLFCFLASMAVTGGVLTVTRTSPVSCALWFTTVVIGTSGLFLLQNAQFLAAAIVIVYVGAIIVMFLFVIMMAHEGGIALYDRISREPVLAVLASFVLLIALVSATVSTYRGEPPALQPEPGRGASDAALLDVVPERPQVAKLGTTLFLEHWVSLEVAGAMLLVAMVGTIVIASRSAKKGT